MRQKFITTCILLYYKIRKFHYKLRESLQNATVVLQDATVITIYNVFYKMHRYNVKLN